MVVKISQLIKRLIRVKGLASPSKSGQNLPSAVNQATSSATVLNSPPANQGNYSSAMSGQTSGGNQLPNLENKKEDMLVKAIELQLQVLMAEYQKHRELILTYKQVQGQIDNIVAVGFGATIPLILGIMANSPTAIGAILLIPIIFISMGFVQLWRVRDGHISAIYIYTVLSKQISDLLGKVPFSIDNGVKVEVLTFESFFFSKNLLIRPKKIKTLVFVTAEYALSLISSILTIAVFAYLKFFYRKSGDFDFFYEGGLLIIDFIGIGIVLYATWKIASNRFNLIKDYIAQAPPRVNTTP